MGLLRTKISLVTRKKKLLLQWEFHWKEEHCLLRHKMSVHDIGWSLLNHSDRCVGIFSLLSTEEVSHLVNSFFHPFIHFFILFFVMFECVGLIESTAVVAIVRRWYSAVNAVWFSEVDFQSDTEYATRIDSDWFKFPGAITLPDR